MVRYTTAMEHIEKMEASTGNEASKTSLTQTPISIPHRPRLHIDTTRPRRRPDALRESLRTMESDTVCGEDSHKRDEHAGGAERRESCERGLCADVEGAAAGI